MGRRRLPYKRGANPGSGRTPGEVERNIIKAYRRFGSNRYELVLLFKPYYLDRTPSPATMDRIKARYPLNEVQKQIIKRYEKQSLRRTCPYRYDQDTKGYQMLF